MPTADARRNLLARLIDHAPMFPPASLPVADALAEDARAVASVHSFMLARLVWPASSFGDVASSERAISAVLDAPLPADARVEAVETRYRDDLASLVELAGDVFVEVPLDGVLEERLDALAAHGLRAKVRCGGAEVPTSAQLAQFVRACRDRGLPFKATAGLHHSVRSNGEHGFLNLLAATVFAGAEEEALDETDPSAFSVDVTSFRWRARSAGPIEVARARTDALWSIGSCSFFEPVEALAAQGVLPL
jgi:hypothetical protein